MHGPPQPGPTCSAQAAASPETGRQIRQLEAERDTGRTRLGDAAIMLLDGRLDKTGYDAAKDAIEQDHPSGVSVVTFAGRT